MFWSRGPSSSAESLLPSQQRQCQKPTTAHRGACRFTWNMVSSKHRHRKKESQQSSQERKLSAQKNSGYNSLYTETVLYIGVFFSWKFGTCVYCSGFSRGMELIKWIWDLLEQLTPCGLAIQTVNCPPMESPTNNLVVHGDRCLFWSSVYVGILKK